MGLRLFDNPLHLVLLLVVILIVFGAGKLPGVGAALGQSIKEFKKASAEHDSQSPLMTTELTGNVCQKCQASNPAGAQFCTACGGPLQPQVTAGIAREVFCAQCGAKNTGSSRFCASCGSGLNVSTA